jgi:hypothetical protein
MQSGFLVMSAVASSGPSNDMERLRPFFLMGQVLSLTAEMKRQQTLSLSRLELVDPVRQRSKNGTGNARVLERAT